MCVCVCVYVFVFMCLFVFVCVFRQRRSYDAQSGYAVMDVDVMFVCGSAQLCLPLLAIAYLYCKLISLTILFNLYCTICIILLSLFITIGCTLGTRLMGMCVCVCVCMCVRCVCKFVCVTEALGGVEPLDGAVNAAHEADGHGAGALESRGSELGEGEHGLPKGRW
jgi:hypothetical protein